MSEEKPVVVGVDYGTENCHEVAVEIYREKVQGIEAADAQSHIPGQEIHRPSRNRGQTPVFIPLDDTFLSGESTHQTSESSDIGAGLSWMDTRGRIGSAMEFIPGDEPNVNSAYGAGYLQPMTHDEKARAFFSQQHTPGQLEGLKQLADSLVIATRPEPIEIKANISIPSPELELDANGLPTTLESAMALDAVDALCAAEDERWKKEIETRANLNPLEKQFSDGWGKIRTAEDEQFRKEIEEMEMDFSKEAMEMDFSKEAIVEMLNEELVAEGREPFYSVQMLSAQAAAAVRKKQKAGKKKKRK